MSEELREKIEKVVRAERYRPMKPRQLAKAVGADDEGIYPAFRKALRAASDAGTITFGRHGAIVARAIESPKPAPAKSQLPGTGVAAKASKRASARGDSVVGLYRQNKRGFGFVMPSEPAGHEDLFIPPGWASGAITGDTVRATISGSEMRDGKMKYEGRVVEVVKRTDAKFVGSLSKQGGKWVVLPDGNDFTTPIEIPDAASRNIKPGTKVAVELTRYPGEGVTAAGVITEVLGQAGEKDVDLRSVIVQHNLPEDFPERCKQQARLALDRFHNTLEFERERRLDLSDQLIVTIDPDDAKDYDDAISIRKLDNGNWQLGVHIADVAFFVEPGSALDEEAAKRGNSVYFPGFVIPMLPEVLSNGVCSLQEGVPRLCKSAFIELTRDGRPVGTKFANTIIKSAKRLRYMEAQAILDRTSEIPHPEGPRKVGNYEREIVELLDEMDSLAKVIQKRRHAAGQLVLGLPEVDLVLDQEGRVTGAVPEDESYTHTIIEMFMVEANEAVARLLDSLDVPFLRRAHAEPPMESTTKLRQFAQVAGYKLPKDLDRKALQSLLETVKERPEAFAINLAVLRSLARAEYSPENVGHYALASQHYAHFTSPIRRYADLTIHRLLDQYFVARGGAAGRAERPAGGGKRPRLQLDDVVPYDELVKLGKHLSFTERRAADAESELREVKLLELLSGRIGEEFHGVVTSVTKFGIFIQLKEYLIDGLIRYEDLLGDFWDVDERGGFVRGKKSGKRIAIGDLATVIVANVDVPRRELTLAMTKLRGQAVGGVAAGKQGGRGTQSKRHRSRGAGEKRDQARPQGDGVGGKRRQAGGAAKRNSRSKQRDRRKGR